MSPNQERIKSEDISHLQQAALGGNKQEIEFETIAVGFYFQNSFISWILVSHNKRKFIAKTEKANVGKSKTIKRVKILFFLEKYVTFYCDVLEIDSKF